MRESQELLARRAALLTTLVAAHGGTLPPEPSYAFTFAADPTRFLQAAQLVKAASVAAYVDLLGALGDPTLVAKLAAVGVRRRSARGRSRQSPWANAVLRGDG